MAEKLVRSETKYEEESSAGKKKKIYIGEKAQNMTLLNTYVVNITEYAFFSLSSKINCAMSVWSEEIRRRKAKGLKHFILLICKQRDKKLKPNLWTLRPFK